MEPMDIDWLNGEPVEDKEHVEDCPSWVGFEEEGPVEEWPSSFERTEEDLWQGMNPITRLHGYHRVGFALEMVKEVLLGELSSLPSQRLLEREMKMIMEMGLWKPKDGATPLETQRDYIYEFLCSPDKNGNVVFLPQGSLGLLLERLHVRLVFVYRREFKDEVLQAYDFTIEPLNEMGSSDVKWVRYLMVSKHVVDLSDDARHIPLFGSHVTRLGNDNEQKGMLQEDVMLYEWYKQTIQRKVMRSFPPELLWTTIFDRLAKVGILHLLQRYERSFQDFLPKKFPRGTQDQGGSELTWYYEFCPEVPGSWVRFPLQEMTPLATAKKMYEQMSLSTLKDVYLRNHIDRGHTRTATQLVEKLLDEVPFCITRSSTALLFRDYTQRIGGNDGVPESLGEDCPPVEVFYFKHIELCLGWFPLTSKHMGDFPADPLKTFLEKKFSCLRRGFSSLVGQRQARAAIMQLILSPALEELEKRHVPLDVSKFNLTFSGPPGSGKTTLGSMVSTFMYFAGILRLDFCDIQSGPGIGSGTGTADQGALMVKRLYHRTRGGMLFIDELPGITATPPTANQTAAVRAIVAQCLLGSCCTVGAGYKDKLETHFFAIDPGLNRRFKEVPFTHFSDDELYEIFQRKTLNLSFSQEAKCVLVWLHAGFKAPDVNGSFCDLLIGALKAELSKSGDQAELLGKPRPEQQQLSAPLTVFAWISVLRMNPFSTLVHEAGVNMWLEAIKDETRSLRALNFDQVKLAKANFLLKQFCLVLKIDPVVLSSLKGVSFDCSGDAMDGTWNMLRLLRERSIVARYAFVLEDEDIDVSLGQPRFFVQSMKECTWEVASEASSALLTWNAQFWSEPEDGPCPCILFFLCEEDDEIIRTKKSHAREETVTGQVMEVCDAAVIGEIRQSKLMAKRKGKEESEPVTIHQIRIGQEWFVPERALLAVSKNTLAYKRVQQSRDLKRSGGGRIPLGDKRRVLGEARTRLEDEAQCNTGGGHGLMLVKMATLSGCFEQ